MSLTNELINNEVASASFEVFIDELKERNALGWVAYDKELGYKTMQHSGELKRQEDILRFFQDNIFSDNPYIRILEKDEPGWKGHKNRAFHQGNWDYGNWDSELPIKGQINLFRHKLLSDAVAEYTHEFQKGDLSKEETKQFFENKRTLIDKLGGDYEKLYHAGEGTEWEAHEVLQPILDSLMYSGWDEESGTWRGEFTELDKIKVLSQIMNLRNTSKQAKQDVRHDRLRKDSSEKTSVGIPHYRF